MMYRVALMPVSLTCSLNHCLRNCRLCVEKHVSNFKTGLYFQYNGDAYINYNLENLEENDIQKNNLI